jgi:hypothetical protein
MSVDAGDALGGLRLIQSILDSLWHKLLGRLVEVKTAVPELACCGKKLVVTTSNGRAMRQVFERS